MHDVFGASNLSDTKIFSAAQPTEVDWPVFEGMSCLPPDLGDFLSRPNSTCELGGMPAYVVNVTNGMRSITHILGPKDPVTH